MYGIILIEGCVYVINGFKKRDSIKKGNFWYNDGNEKYLFRSCILEELVYIELIMEEIFKEFNIDCVHYEPAMSNEDYGVTCKSFINPNPPITITKNTMKIFGAAAIVCSCTCVTA